MDLWPHLDSCERQTTHWQLPVVILRRTNSPLKRRIDYSANHLRKTANTKFSWWIQSVR